MVIDPFSALGLAANIVQFLDFGQKLVSKGKEIYMSADGQQAHHFELELIYDDLSVIASTLTTPSAVSVNSNTSIQTRPTNAVDSQIHRLATACEELAHEFLSVIRNLKVDPNTKHRKWKSFRQALKSLGKNAHLEELRSRLAGFREELTIRLIAVLG